MVSLFVWNKQISLKISKLRYSIVKLTMKRHEQLEFPHISLLSPLPSPYRLLGCPAPSPSLSPSCSHFLENNLLFNTKIIKLYSYMSENIFRCKAPLKPAMSLIHSQSITHTFTHGCHGAAIAQGLASIYSSSSLQEPVSHSQTSPDCCHTFSGN